MKTEKILRVCFVMLGFGLTVTPAIHAHSEKPPYEMAVILDAAQGGAMRAGNYEQAIARLEPATGRRRDRFAHANNLCVGYTMLENFDAAAEACNAAVQLTEQNATRRTRKILTTHVRDRAMALSNLAILKLLTDDVPAARKYLDDAIELGTSLRQPVRNLRRLNSESARVVAAQ